MELLMVLLLQEVDPQIGGVRLSNRPILGPDVGPTSYPAATEIEAPHGIVDKVKQLVGLGPATPAVCFLFHKGTSSVVLSKGSVLLTWYSSDNS